MSPQKNIDTSGVYSDDTGIYNLDNINNSSGTLIESTDTELYKLDEDVIDSLMIIDTNAEEPKEPKPKNKRKGKPRKLRTKSRLASTQQNRLIPSLKCPMKNCDVQRNTRKEINLHYVKKTQKTLCVRCVK